MVLWPWLTTLQNGPDLNLQARWLNLPQLGQTQCYVVPNGIQALKHFSEQNAIHWLLKSTISNFDSWIFMTRFSTFNIFFSGTMSGTVEIHKTYFFKHHLDLVFMTRWCASAMLFLATLALAPAVALTAGLDWPTRRLKFKLINLFVKITVHLFLKWEVKKGYRSYVAFSQLFPWRCIGMMMLWVCHCLVRPPCFRITRIMLPHQGWV